MNNQDKNVCIIEKISNGEYYLFYYDGVSQLINGEKEMQFKVFMLDLFDYRFEFIGDL